MPTYILDRFNEDLKRKTNPYGQEKKLFFIKIMQRCTSVQNHPQYSPDLTPCN